MKSLDAAIVTMRNSSKRLPNKSIAKITDKLTTADIIIQRAKLTGLPVILATSTDQSDDSLEVIGKNQNISVFRGSLHNKIKRWYDCFTEYNLENALLIDGDDLCYDFEIGQRALSELKVVKSDIIWVTPEIVTGLFTLAITKTAIQKLYDCASDDNLNMDLFTHIFEEAKLKIQYITLKEHEKNKDIRLTLDYEEDLEFFKKLYNQISHESTGKEIIGFLMKNPNIATINYHREKDFLENKKIEVEDDR